VTAAVTGGTGFIGGALLRQLRAAGTLVRALVRRPVDDARLSALGVTTIRGDLTTGAGLAELVTPGAVVYHAAARVDMVGRWEEFHALTVAGTQRLLDAALPQRPRRFVYVSSASVYDPAYAARGVVAGRTPERPATHNFYARAKLMAEQLVRERCDAAAVEWAIVRLGFVYGPGNRALHTRMLPLLRRGQVHVIGSGSNRIATVFVDDAARALVLAGTHAVAGRRIYDVASPEHVTQAEFLAATAAALGAPPPARPVPRAVAWTAAAGAEAWAAATGGVPTFTRAMVMLMSADQVVDAGASTRELGWQPQTSFAAGMAQVAAEHSASSGAYAHTAAVRAEHSAHT
jgi:nucleoside-diphosphate-sugar epimerase